MSKKGKLIIPNEESSEEELWKRDLRKQLDRLDKQEKMAIYSFIFLALSLLLIYLIF